jgi:hypothetical protein
MLKVEILQHPALRSFLSSKYPANELSQFATQLERLLFSAFLAEVNCLPTRN